MDRGKDSPRSNNCQKSSTQAEPVPLPVYDHCCTNWYCHCNWPHLLQLPIWSSVGRVFKSLVLYLILIASYITRSISSIKRIPFYILGKSSNSLTHLATTSCWSVSFSVFWPSFPWDWMAGLSVRPCFPWHVELHHGCWLWASHWPLEQCLVKFGAFIDWRLKAKLTLPKQ